MVAFKHRKIKMKNINKDHAKTVLSVNTSLDRTLLKYTVCL